MNLQKKKIESSKTHHAFGSFKNKIGSIGDINYFSFDGIKILRLRRWSRPKIKNFTVMQSSRRYGRAKIQMKEVGNMRKKQGWRYHMVIQLL